MREDFFFLMYVIARIISSGIIRQKRSKQPSHNSILRNEFSIPLTLQGQSWPQLLTKLLMPSHTEL